MREVKEVGQSLAVSLVETESESGTESRVKNKAIYQTVYIESSQSPGQIDNNKNGLSECGSLVESRVRVKIFSSGRKVRNIWDILCCR